MMNLSKRERLLIFLLLTISIVAFYSIYFLLPQWDQLSAHRTDLATEKSLLEVLKAKNGDENPTVEEQSVIEQLENLHKNMPTQFSMPFIYQELMDIKDQSLVEYQFLRFSMPESISQEEVSSTSKLNKLNVEISLMGSYDNIKEYLDLIYNLDREYTISNMQLKSLDEGLELGLTASTYALYSSGDSIDTIDYSYFKGVYGKDNPY